MSARKVVLEVRGDPVPEGRPRAGLALKSSGGRSVPFLFSMLTGRRVPWGKKVLPALGPQGLPIVRMRAASKSEAWRKRAAGVYRRALELARLEDHRRAQAGELDQVVEGRLEGPLMVFVEAVFPLPKSDRRKRERVPRRWHDKASADVDNLAKSALDAANGVLWRDDCQVALLLVVKVVAAQDVEEPRVGLEVWELRSMGVVDWMGAVKRFLRSAFVLFQREAVNGGDGERAKVLEAARR